MAIRVVYYLIQKSKIIIIFNIFWKKVIEKENNFYPNGSQLSINLKENTQKLKQLESINF